MWVIKSGQPDGSDGKSIFLIYSQIFWAKTSLENALVDFFHINLIRRIEWDGSELLISQQNSKSIYFELILWVSELIPLHFGCLNLYFGCLNLYRCTLGVWTYMLSNISRFSNKRKSSFGTPHSFHGMVFRSKTTFKYILDYSWVIPTEFSYAACLFSFYRNKQNIWTSTKQ